MQREAVDFYDPDDCVPEQSDFLAPVVPKYRHEDTPPPYVSADSSVSDGEQSAGEEEQGQKSSTGRRPTKKNRRRGGPSKPKPNLGTAVLIRALEPNRPDLAQEAVENPLERTSDEGSEGNSMSIDEDEAEAQHGLLGGHNSGRLPSTKWPGVDMSQNVDQRYVRVEKSRDLDRRVQAAKGKRGPNGLHLEGIQGLPKSQPSSPPSEPPQPRTPLNLVPPPLPPPPRPPLSVNTSSRSQRHNESIARSPNLARYTIEGDRGSQLPAMQMSPPRSSAVQSPESSTTLPSLSTALSMDSNGSGHFSFPGHSPNLSRASSSQHFGPSPLTYNHHSPGMSPPSFFPSLGPTLGSYRTRNREESISTSTPSDHNQATPASVPTPATSISDTSYHTAAGHRAGEKYHHHSLSQKGGMVVDTSTLKHAASISPTSATRGQLPPQSHKNGISIDDDGQAQPVTANTFECSYLGCTAAPFQTQYLLNSHANVHSSSRPHYCPVEDCPRGPGGRGFKRKNEMIRHGLVHASPGYVCPFCPDQQHKYPRPDNLQRHVRVHHTDRDRDDPLLRQVLAARPEGSTSSGRLGGNSSLRRRSNSSRAPGLRPAIALTTSTSS